MILRKYANDTKTYTTIPDATFKSVTIGGKQAMLITYQIKDGGPFDEDGTANGSITDPAGPAVLAATTTNPASPNTGLPEHSSSLGTISLFSGVGILSFAAVTKRRVAKKQ